MLNAYFPLGYNPGGFRAWWRRLHDSRSVSLPQIVRLSSPDGRLLATADGTARVWD